MRHIYMDDSKRPATVWIRSKHRDVVETVGAALPESLAATAVGGLAGVVGFVAGYEATIPVRAMLGPMLRVQRIAVGSRAGFDAMNRAMVAGGIHPVIGTARSS